VKRKAAIGEKEVDGGWVYPPPAEVVQSAGGGLGKGL